MVTVCRRCSSSGGSVMVLGLGAGLRVKDGIAGLGRRREIER